MKARFCVVLAIVVSILGSGAGIALAQEAEPTPTPEAKKINMNIASLEELETLPGITPETAEAIIEGRPYTKVEDLLNIQGIDEKKFAKIQDLIEVKKINVNSATLEELTLLPGITPEIAEAIIEGRLYKKVEDLLNLEGIDKKKFAKIRDLIEVKINVNSATLEELTLLPGITPEIAEAIIAGRRYMEVEDLLNLEGIDEKELEKIREYVEVGVRGRRSRSRRVRPASTPIP